MLKKSFMIFFCCVFFSSFSQALETKTVPPSNEKYVFIKYGLANLKINQSFKSTGLVEMPDTRLENCFYAEHKKEKNDLLYIQIMDDKVAVISSNSPLYQSYTAVKIGDNVQNVYRKHNNQKVEKILNPYGDFKNQYALFYWQDSSKKMGIRYDIDHNKVELISVGNEHLTLMEGCA